MFRIAEKYFNARTNARYALFPTFNLQMLIYVQQSFFYNTTESIIFFKKALKIDRLIYVKQQTRLRKLTSFITHIIN